jgi:hypothetical protein
MGSMGTSRVAVEGMISGKKVEVEAGILTVGNQSQRRYSGASTDCREQLIACYYLNAWQAWFFLSGMPSLTGAGSTMIDGM